MPGLILEPELDIRFAYFFREWCHWDITEEICICCPLLQKNGLKWQQALKDTLNQDQFFSGKCLVSEVSQVWNSKLQQLISLQSGRLSYREGTPFFIRYYLNFVTAAVRVGSFQKTTFWVKIAFCFFATKGHNKPAKNSSFFIFLWRQLLMLIKEKDFSSNVKVCEECV